jgi:hypothetical protein
MPPATEVMGACGRTTALMPQELFFELMTTSPESQRCCFALRVPGSSSPRLEW